MGTKDGYHHGDLRHALVAATTRMLRRSGVEALSLREVAREVGVAPSAMYNHFEDKTALLTAVAQEGFAELGRAMAAARAGSTRRGAAGARQRLRAMGRAYVAFALGHRSQFQLMFGEDRRARRPVEGVTRAFESLVEAIAALPLRADAREAAWRMWAAVHGVASLLGDGASTATDVDSAIDGVVDTMLDGLSAR